ncbi:MAG: type II toxin-antitoxin system VapC family toxin [Burkholderiales bacterium]|nr:tRNA(fMet)-specific endonuclease VapC [Rhodocyclaceae bacterium]MCZ2418901.1 type II toxin-antitoxin system VapC family toxin [Burkholderiales bacterium]HNQ56329.1 type II toxin-antitoxin system VapC family toxin [Candidatus Desulfobacillus denitrificans]HNT61637.1 type II toxin-antitoxin system VapC family toxin [Candidatus Desulfobacillus denitrificans]
MTLYVSEPPLSYVARPPAVVDANVLAAFVFGEPEGEEALARLHPYALHAPTLLPYEIANVAMNKLRRGQASPADLAARLEGFDFGLIRLADTRPAGVFSLAQRYRLPAYDASYLWLAAELRAPLLTFDGKLAAAAADCLAGLTPPE